MDSDGKPSQSGGVARPSVVAGADALRRSEAPSIVVVEEDAAVLATVAVALRAAGYDVLTAIDAAEALLLVRDVRPDLVIADVSVTGGDEMEFVQQLRALPGGAETPFIFLTSLGSTYAMVTGMQLGADDYLRKPIDTRELVGRVRAKLEPTRDARDASSFDPRRSFLSPREFRDAIRIEAVGQRKRVGAGAVAVVRLVELETLRQWLGPRAADELKTQVLAALATEGEPLATVASGTHDELWLLLVNSSSRRAAARLTAAARKVAEARFSARGELVRLTPVVGFAMISDDAERTLERARVAVREAERDLDLRPRAWSPVAGEPRMVRARALFEKFRLPLQIFATQLPLVLPFFGYVLLDGIGWNIAPVIYLVVVAALLMTATLIWIEGLAALPSTEPPEEPVSPYPHATAIIAAYLPSEAATILSTVEAFLAQDYPGDLQVIVAYNTPGDLPVERELRAIAARDSRLLPYRVAHSTSKAQNVNAALAIASGEFIGLFDADHHPAPGSFRRAWRWLSNGYDIVQGHCVVRNGDASWVARTVAIEFEMIYAVSHPGRARLHGFAIFGGSNGFWRTRALQETRMHVSMLTEDIDASMRVLESGHKIASDRGLISRELAPTTVRNLWNQRMRWAQGWFQVGKRYAWRGLRSPGLTLRNKIGLFYLLVWREIYPWISLQMFAIIAFYAYKAGGPDRLDWFMPIFVLTTLFTLSTGPWQTLFAWKLAAAEVKQHRGWFLLYLVVSSLFYTELKNVISRVAQIKELMREAKWRITPRSAPATEDG